VVEVKIKKEKGKYIKGKTYLVTPNIAHGLIDAGFAVKYVPKKKYKKQTRVMRAGSKGKMTYRTK